MKKRDEKLAAQIIEEFHEAGQKGDVAAFKRLLGTHAAHVPRAVKDKLIAEFIENVELLRKSLRGRWSQISWTFFGALTESCR